MFFVFHFAETGQNASLLVYINVATFNGFRAIRRQNFVVYILNTNENQLLLLQVVRNIILSYDLCRQGLIGLSLCQRWFVAFTISNIQVL